MILHVKVSLHNSALKIYLLLASLFDLYEPSGNYMMQISPLDLLFHIHVRHHAYCWLVCL